MSSFSGACDVYDWFDGRNVEHIKESIIHVGSETIHDMKPYDLVQYYPYIVAIGYANNIGDGYSVIQIVPPERLANVYMERWVEELRVCGYSEKEIENIISKINLDNEDEMWYNIENERGKNNVWIQFWKRKL